MNCTGLSAYNLCQDASLNPSRGQVLKVCHSFLRKYLLFFADKWLFMFQMKAPWIKHASICIRKSEEKQGLVTYIFPR